MAGRPHLDREATLRLGPRPLLRSAFRQVPRTVLQANPTTVAVLGGEWLAEAGHEMTDPAGDEPPASDADARQRLLAEIVRRQGQPLFRLRLLDAYDGRCAVTGEAAEQVLEADHVRPYRGPQSHEVSVGLLLRADLHTLFDRHLVSVDAAGALLVSEELRGTSY